MSLCKEGLRAAFWGAGPASQLDGDGLHVSWVPESFVSVSFTHTHSPSQLFSHTPLSCSPWSVLLASAPTPSGPCSCCSLAWLWLSH